MYRPEPRRAGASASIDEETFLGGIDDPGYRSSVEHVLEAARSPGYRIEWGLRGGAIKIPTLDHPDPLSVGWLFDDVAGNWNGLRNLTLGFQPASLAKRQSVERAVARYEEALPAIPGARRVVTANQDLRGYGFDREILPGGETAVIACLAQLAHDVQQASGVARVGWSRVPRQGERAAAGSSSRGRRGAAHDLRSRPRARRGADPPRIRARSGRGKRQLATWAAIPGASGIDGRRRRSRPVNPRLRSARYRRGRAIACLKRVRGPSYDAPARCPGMEGVGDRMRRVLAIGLVSSLVLLGACGGGGGTGRRHGWWHRPAGGGRTGRRLPPP
ncbi:MAG: hypothetical protein KatS3mg014_1244 [Actinomycetota bacterium]|nr:MAG: hypothetical protein KatS3mg014_1244 [Actinomycetota bacterium]